MAVAALTPRVRVMAICDDATPSDIESDVYTLEGVRQGIVAEALPCRCNLVVFLVLSCPRPGSHAGSVRVIDMERDKVIRLQDFQASFDGSNPRISVAVSLANCVFAAAGEYTFELSFLAGKHGVVVKGEQSLFITLIEE